MTKWTQAAKLAYFKEHPDCFAGPDMSYPIKDASDVSDAAGQAKDPGAVRNKIVEIARKLGFADALPESWKDEDADRAAPVEDNDEKDAASDDENDKDDKDSGESKRADLEPEFIRSMPTDVTYYAPIDRINKEKREVIGTATAEVKDAHGTVIGYDASKDAFARWAGNIREMHQKKAVGRALEITPDDVNRRIIVRARISKGAEDTWQKVLDGTLSGFSIGGRNGKWTERLVAGEKVPFLERYDQSELSLVDNPSNPSSNDVAIVRADGLASDVFASEDEVETSKSEPAKVERAGAKLSKKTVNAMHSMRDHSMSAAKSSMETCGCDECNGMLNKVNADSDSDGDDRAAIAEIVRDVLTDVLRDQFAPVGQRVNALLARQAQQGDERTEPDTEITRRVDDLSDKLGQIYDLVKNIAEQPTDGGPVLHGAPMDKRLATQGSPTRADDNAIIQRALDMGFTPPAKLNDQLKAAATLISNQR